MQLVSPIDIEDAMRKDLSELIESDSPITSCFAPPPPDTLSAKSLMVTSLGGTSATAVSNEHDVSVDVWADTPAEAMAAANWAAGRVASLPLRQFSSGRHYVTAEINALPYLNPDPNRPLLPRATFRATVNIRGLALRI